MTSLVAGVDSSTQSCKVELRDLESGALVASGSAPHPPAAPPRSEQRPEAWWTAFRAAFGVAAERMPSGASVVAVSVAAQCHGLVALDEEHRVIRDAKLWNDTTSAPELRELRGRIGDDALIRAIGSLPTAAFTIGKVAWLAAHEPENFAALRHILLPHDYLTFRLTGRMVTDRSEASGTGYFDAAANRYLPEHLQLIDADKPWGDMLPEVLPPEGIAGTVLPEVAAELGISPDTIVGAGGGDQHAAALGLGIESGDVVYSFGTSGVVFAVNELPVYDPQGHVNGVADMNNGFLPLVCTLNAAKVTDTFARILGVDHAELSALALAAPPDGPSLAAFLDGERTPDRPGATGLLAGITSSTTREQVARAAYEGVVFGLVNGQRQLERCGVQTGGAVFAVGGGARSGAYTQLLADALGSPVRVADAPEATARGAAVQAAAVASGRTVAGVRAAWRPASTVVAEPRVAEPGASADDPRWRAYLRTASVDALDRSAVAG
ncbi:xylulokinase [Okibacterium endophyticum]